ncbi:aminoimidazole riboside kinase [Pasteurella dagmatis]|uniref:Kinase, PfkB family n=1 Tax=Pasteurella dagmatis ATCC 43325 TaxID=667128 RepID=C9PS99_9PAST|nr:aminoimidazole riboside kinase [Pasteurella dagmatis]EEX49518.1 kinase, PfkB family [Pasteurella dagmatis ATCC 43325]SNV83803.1 fructokinase [Pasteurella dagmatis]
MGKIWVLGDAVVDLIPEGANAYLRCAGGAPANVAVGIARLGGTTGFIGRVGDDPLGRFMLQTLQQENVCTQHMSLDPQQRTSTVIVELNEGERSFTFMVNPSADQFLDLSDLPHFNSNDWLHCCSIALINEPSRSTTFEAIRRIKAEGGFFSFDPNLRESLWKSSAEMKSVVNQVVALADVLKFSEEELVFLTDSKDLSEATSKLAKRYPEKLIIVTLGKLGATYYLQGESELVSCKPLIPVDTTGAGDAFVSGLLFGISQVENWKNSTALTQIIKQANACGALATTAKGAMSALPNKQQLDAFLAE